MKHIGSPWKSLLYYYIATGATSDRIFPKSFPRICWILCHTLQGRRRLPRGKEPWSTSITRFFSFSFVTKTALEDLGLCVVSSKWVKYQPYIKKMLSDHVARIPSPKLQEVVSHPVHCQPTLHHSTWLV